MSLTLEDLKDLQDGKRDPIWVGEMPYYVAVKLGLKNHNVYLSLESLRHILEERNHVPLLALLNLPFTIQRGLLIQEKKKPTIILASYFNAEIRKRYITAMKIKANATEIWVHSFYRSSKRQTKSLLRRGTILKNHD